jgi:hypothetical protein
MWRPAQDHSLRRMQVGWALLYIVILLHIVVLLNALLAHELHFCKTDATRSRGVVAEAATPGALDLPLG